MFGSPTLHQNPETSLTESWEYDALGRLKSATAGSMRYEYSYDANNRLIEVQYPHILGNLKDGNTAFEKLSYDKAGNRTLRVTESLTEQYHYDNCNRLTRLDTTPTDLSKPQTIRFYRYDKQGNMLSDGANTYSYDGFNRLTEVCTEDGSIQKNRYDAEGLRHEMEENGQLVKFLYNENREVEVEEESNGNIIRYIRGLGIISSDSESARTYYHYVSDEQGSVTHVLEGENKDVVEACGAEEPHRILNRYTYDAFGNTIECEEQVHNRFRYNGEQYDPVTSQYYLRARFYNPAIARFTQEDTYYGDGLNLYQYCANNPVGYADPTGHLCEVLKSVYDKNRAENADMPASEAFTKADNLRRNLSDAEKDQIRQLYQQSKTDPEAAAQLNKLINDLEDKYINKINQAIEAQKQAQDIAKDYGGKSVASDGETNTLSGWGKYKDPNNVIDRTVTPQDVMQKSKDIGHDLQQNSFLDNVNRGGTLGQSKASHAEKQLSLITNKPIGVAPIKMCDDCITYFSKLSVYENRTIIVADPLTIRIFESDGSIKEIKR